MTPVRKGWDKYCYLMLSGIRWKTYDGRRCFGVVRFAYRHTIASIILTHARIYRLCVKTTNTRTTTFDSFMMCSGVWSDTHTHNAHEPHSARTLMPFVIGSNLGFRESRNRLWKTTPHIFTTIRSLTKGPFYFPTMEIRLVLIPSRTLRKGCPFTNRVYFHKETRGLQAEKTTLTDIKWNPVLRPINWSLLS